MKLMAYLGLGLVFALPAKAIHVDGGIECYSTQVVAQAETAYDYWEWWEGIGAVSVYVAATGPQSASAYDSAWYPEYWASATATVPSPPAGNYEYAAIHYFYDSWANNWGSWQGPSSSCGVQGPAIEISGSQSVMDGLQGSFSVTVVSGTPTGYQWEWSAPMSAGNNPSVSFGNPTGASTTTNAHWFADPDDACNAGYNSTYEIRVNVSFSGGISLEKTTNLTVTTPDVAGDVDVNSIHIVGFPATGVVNGLWRVTGQGSLVRQGSPVVSIAFPSSSQFYSKTNQHEQVHVTQSAGYWRVTDLMAVLQTLSDQTSSGLNTKIQQAMDQVEISENARWEAESESRETAAYAVSNSIAPQYIYQNCGP